MNVRNLLTGALAAQVALGVLTWWPRGDVAVDAEPLVPGGGAAITALTILGKGEGKVPVELVSEDGTWKLGSAHGYPADPDKVQEVVQALGELVLRAPIATQAASHEGLGVTADGYERKLTITADGVTRTLFVGAAASKAIHVRLDGEDAVHRIKGVSAWELKDETRSYLPTNHVDLDTTKLVRFEVDNALGRLVVEKTDGAWSRVVPEPGPLDGAAVDALVEKAAKVRLSEVAGTEVLPEHGLTQGATRVAWTLDEEGVTVQGGYVFGPEADGKAFLKTDDSPFVVRSPTYRLKDLATLDPATFGLAGPVAVP